MVSYPRERTSESLVFTLCSDCHNMGSRDCTVCILDRAFTPTRNMNIFLILLK